MKWINQNAQEIRTLLNDYNVDPDYGLILVLTQYSAPSYSRVVVPSNLAEEGVVLGLSNGTTWVEPEDAPRTLTMIDHYEVLLTSKFCSHLAETGRVSIVCEWLVNQKVLGNAPDSRYCGVIMLFGRPAMEEDSQSETNSAG